MKTSLLVLAAVVSLAAKPVSSPLDPARWTFLMSGGPGAHPQALAGMAGFWFAVPQNVTCPDGLPCDVAYLSTPAPGSLLGSQALIATIQVVPTQTPALFNCAIWEPCTVPAAVRLYVHRQKDPYYSGVNARWWASVYLNMVDGSATLVAPIRPDGWSNVNGQRGDQNVAAWSDTFSHLADYGLTFGGDFFGHGVNMSQGAANVIVTGWAVQ